MQFRLVYQGSLKSNADGKTKATIRKRFDAQLRQLWEQEPLNDLNDFRDPSRRQNTKPGQIYLGVSKGPVEFIPVVSASLKVRAELDVLILANKPPGDIVGAGGDLDNRIKTLLDALTVPSQIPVVDVPGEDGRVYCLFSDDKLASRVSIETDRWLEIDRKSRDALVIVQCQIFATIGTMANISIAI